MDPFERLMARFDPLSSQTPVKDSRQPQIRNTQAQQKRRKKAGVDKLNHNVEFAGTRHVQSEASLTRRTNYKTVRQPNQIPIRATTITDLNHPSEVTREPSSANTAPLAQQFDSADKMQAAQRIQQAFREKRLQGASGSSVPVFVDPAVTHVQQVKKALAVMAAHQVTEDFLALQSIGDDGLLLTDRTERRLKLIKSLSELQKGHIYITEYGNQLQQLPGGKVCLAESIEIQVEDVGKEEKAPSSTTLAPPRLGERMQAYSEFTENMRKSFSRVSEEEPETQEAPPAISHEPSTSNGGSAISMLPAAAGMAILEERVQCLEGWVQGLKTSSIHDNQMREQSAIRVSMVEERLCKIEDLIAGLRIDVTDLKLEAASGGDEETNVVGNISVSSIPRAVQLKTSHTKAKSTSFLSGLIQ